MKQAVPSHNSVESERRERQRKYQREYRKRPEVKEYSRDYARWRYNNDTKHREKIKARQRRYYQTHPDLREKMAVHQRERRSQQREEWAKKHRFYVWYKKEVTEEEIRENLERVKRGEALTLPLAILNGGLKAKFRLSRSIKEYMTPEELEEMEVQRIERRREAKARVREYCRSPEGRAKARKYYQRPDVKAKKKKYYQRPDVKARVRELNKMYYQKKKMRGEL